MDRYLPYVMAAIGAAEGHILVSRFISPTYAGMGAAIGAHVYVLSAQSWARRYGIMDAYLWLVLIMMWLVALEWS